MRSVRLLTALVLAPLVLAGLQFGRSVYHGHEIPAPSPSRPERTRSAADYQFSKQAASQMIDELRPEPSRR